MGDSIGALGDWPHMGHVRQVQVACESCSHVRLASIGGFSVPVVLCAGDDSRFRWTSGSVSVRRWRALTDMRQPVGRGTCPECGVYGPCRAAGITKGAKDE